MIKFENSIFIDAPFEKVYKYGTNPENWSHWVVNLSETDIKKGKGEVGSIVEFKYAVLGIHFHETLEVTRYDVTEDGCMWKSKFTGALEGEHEWSYLPKDNGVEVRMSLSSTVPGKVLAIVADNFIVEKLMSNAFKNSLENLKVICETK